MKTPPILTSILFTAVLCFGADAEPSCKPNIVIILADDLGYGDLGSYGATTVKTPHVDRLAAEGMRFTKAYAPAATCTPTRYSLLTGEYAWRQKAKQTSILDGDAPLAIEPGRVTLASMLGKVGYATGVVGKWHLGLGDGKTRIDFNGTVKPGPLELGFDSSYIIPATVDRVPSVWIENHKVDGLDAADPIEVSYLKNISDEPTGIERPDLLKQPADKQHACTIINGISRIGYMKGGKAARFKDEDLGDTVVAKSAEFIGAHKNETFFLLVGLFEPHVPRTPHPRFVGTSGCGVRGDVIHQIDWQVGKVMKALEKNGLADDTMVIVTSDNGPLFFDGYFDRSLEEANGHRPAGDLRGWKYLVYEGGCRVPFIVRWPGKVPSGESDRMFCLTDLLATCASMAGAKVPDGVGVDSIDQSLAFLGKKAKSARDAVVLQGVSGGIAIRSGDWKFIPANAKDQPAGIGSGANPNDTRFSQALIDEPLLFDLSQDPEEKRNIAPSHPKKVAELSALLKKIRSGEKDDR